MPAPAIAAAPRDEDLMLAYAAGDAAAFDALYARHKGGVYRYVLRQCAHAGVADELFQDVWMNVIRARASYVPSAKFTTWLYRIAHNRLIDHWRAIGQVELVTAGADDDADDPLEAIPAARDDEPEARASARELSSRLKAACAALPAAQREAFLLHQEGGLELAEIAALTGAGVETVKSRIRYAVAKLRVELGDSAMTTPKTGRSPDARRSARRPTHGARRRAKNLPRPLDAAILAAARREAGAKPQPVGAREATAARRQWWPLAAAATVAAIAVGVLQLTPTRKLGAPAAETAIVSDVPAPVARVAPQSAQSVPPADETKRAGGNGAPARKETSRADASPPPASAAGAPEPKRPAAAPAQVSPPVAEPFPDAPKVAADTARPSAAPPAEPVPPQEAPRSPPAVGSVAAERAAPARGAAASAEIGAAPAMAPAPAPPPPPRTEAAASRMSERASPPPAAAPLAKMAAGSAADTGTSDARIKDRIPLPIPDWIALIRRLRDEGKTAEAAKELVAFRAAHVDHEKLLPPDLRDWRPPEK